MNIPFDPSPSGQGAHHFFATPSFGSWRRGAWAWAGVAGRWARRHAAPAVVGRFIFFRDLAFFGDSEDSGFAGQDGRTDGRADGRTKPGSPQTPFLRTENRQNFIAKIFFGDFKKVAGANLHCWYSDMFELKSTMRGPAVCSSPGGGGAAATGPNGSQGQLGLRGQRRARTQGARAAPRRGVGGAATTRPIGSQPPAPLTGGMGGSDRAQCYLRRPASNHPKGSFAPKPHPTCSANNTHTWLLHPRRDNGMWCGECALGVAGGGGHGQRRHFGNAPASFHPLILRWTPDHGGSGKQQGRAPHNFSS